MANVWSEQSAQDTFEYLLLAGAFVVPFAAALIGLAAFVIPEIAGHVCPAVDTAADPSPSVGSCLGF